MFGKPGSGSSPFTKKPTVKVKRQAKPDFVDNDYEPPTKTAKPALSKQEERKLRKAQAASGGRDSASGGAGHKPQFDGERRPKKRREYDDQAEYERDAPREEDTRVPGRHVVLANQGNPSAILTPEAISALKTRFGAKADVIINQIESDDTDGAATLLYKSLLQSLVEIIPIAEGAVLSSGAKRGVYQYNQIVSQTRELLADIQAMRDRGLLGNSIVERHLRPAFMDIAVQIVVSMTSIEQAARTRMSKEDFLSFRGEIISTAKSSLADYIKAQYEEVSSSVVQSLS